jgi:hypothetical protein
VVEIADTEDGVLFRVHPTGEFAFLISRWAWADFLAAVAAGEYDTTLPRVEDRLRRSDGT